MRFSSRVRVNYFVIKVGAAFERRMPYFSYVVVVVVSIYTKEKKRQTYPGGLGSSYRMSSKPENFVN